MNIFAVRPSPEEAARDLCDKHVVKMPLETAQMLCTALARHGVTDTPYKPCFQNHPCTKWAGDTMGNYIWLARHGLALCAEYTRRYGREHRCQAVIEWCRAAQDVIPWGDLTPHPQAMPEDTKRACPHHAYRMYYRRHKRHIATWKGVQPPTWWGQR